MSFLQFEIVQHRAETQMRILALVFFVDSIQPISEHNCDIGWRFCCAFSKDMFWLSAIWISCKIFVESFMLNTMSFLQFEIDQHRAETQMRILVLVFFVDTIRPISKHICHIGW
jgi:hypothetical protein